ncbi:MAG: sulfatase [Planctomycetota bacterium]|jgi:arylsulfatase A-like enzyme|nr:sulfatase [Planctomycetota bacterium]
MNTPNIVICLVDQMRMQAMEFWNTPGFELPSANDPVHTPNLNRFARESLVLSKAVSNNPICSPYRGMFMTGQYSHQSGVPSNCQSRNAPYGCELPATTRCWSDVLSDQGYSLGWIGKWHLDMPHAPYLDCANNGGEMKWNEWCPPERRHGFDHWYAYGTYDMHLRPLYWHGEAAREDFHYVDQWGPEHETDRALEYLANADGTWRQTDAPFALVVSMNPPHTPYNQVPEHLLERYRGMSEDELVNRPNVNKADHEGPATERRHMANYLAMVEGIDQQFGRILQSLDDNGLRDDTIVIFTADHGCSLGSHDNRHKSIWYDESLLVPFLARWPGHIAARHDSELLLSVPDIAPTLLELSGHAAAIPATVTGTSQAARFLSAAAPVPSSALYQLMPASDPASGRRGVRTASHTMVIDLGFDGGTPATYLHDNEADPYQLRNVATEQPELLATLIATELRPWLERLQDPWIAAATAAGALNQPQAAG